MRALPGSRETLEEMRCTKYRLALACRLVQSHVRDAMLLVKQCERYGSVSDFNQQIGKTALYILLSMQDVTAAGNTALRALKRFNNTTKGN